MIAETMEVVRKYNMAELSGAPLVDRTARVPASTRILGMICEVEKSNKQQGEWWMSALFEFAEWVRRDERRKIAEGR
jgi:hypothetical protein